MAKRKTWQERLESPIKHKIKRIDYDFAGIPAGSTMFVATPQIIENYVKQIPYGKEVSPQTMRQDLALENLADYTCPASTGVFLRIIAEVSFEAFQKNNSVQDITPFWRIIGPKSQLARKLNCGPNFIIEQRLRENIKI